MKVTLKKVDNDFHLQGFGTSGVPVNLDGAESIGGHNQGARPMELMLMALGSCSAMDMISILRKQKLEIEDFNVEINASRRENETPSIFEKIHMTFLFKGNLDEEKIKRAVELSVEKYCSVYNIIKETAEITYSYKIIN